MSLPSIQFDGKLTQVILGGVTLWFSYETLVAFRVGGMNVLRSNEWGATTCRHLNTIAGGAGLGRRVEEAEFQRLYRELVEEREWGGVPGE